MYSFSACIILIFIFLVFRKYLATISNSLDDLDKASCYNIGVSVHSIFDLFWSGEIRLVQFFGVSIINISMSCKNFPGNVEGVKIILKL